MKAVLNTTDVWTPLQVTITLDTELEYLALKNIYSVQEVTSLVAEHRVRDRDILTNLVKHIVDVIK
jgi:hypothetical protein